MIFDTPFSEENEAMTCSYRYCDNPIHEDKNNKAITGESANRQKHKYCSVECRNNEVVAEYIELHDNDSVVRSSSFPINSRFFGNVLLKDGKITQYQLEKALELKSMNGRRPLAYYMLKRGWIKRNDVLTTLAKIHRVPYIVLGNRPQAPLLSAKFPKEFLRKAGVLPFSFNRPINRLCVAMTDPSDLSAIMVLKTISGSQIQVFQGDPAEIEQFLNKKETSLFLGGTIPVTAAEAAHLTL